MKPIRAATGHIPVLTVYQKVVNGSRCGATILVKDDRWGGWQEQCEGVSDHPGAHFVAMSACEPVALKVWLSSPAVVER